MAPSTTSAQPDPVQTNLAIVGIGCRLPAGIAEPRALWEFLRRGGDAIRPVPPDRWDPGRFYDANPDRTGKAYTMQAGFLDELPVDFDAAAFGLSPRESAHLDPQQRLLLEATWEAFENAGVPIAGLRGSPTGVFMGGFTLDMLVSLLSPLNRELISNHTPTAATLTMLANRVSFVFDLRGPSIACDTACSSSLTAFHLACQSLWRGECTCAVAGGANLMLRPEFPIAMSKGRFLSPDGRCKTFDARADGYGRGEGAAVVILKPLAAAQQSGDRIYAVVHATGTNQDGRTSGITLPNREAQEALMRQVYAASGLDPQRIAYVEAHGTGTQAGDTTEAAAVGAVLGHGRPAQRPLLIGSVKTNFGHLEAASGILGVIKAALSLHHREVPPNLHFETPNPAIPFTEWGLRVPTAPELLPDDGLAAINSFGYGGSNVHVVLGPAPGTARPTNGHAVTPKTVRAQPPLPGPARMLPFSAHSPEALRALAGSFVRWLDGPGIDANLADLAHTLTVRRSQLDHRLVVTAPDRQSLREALAACARGEPHPDITTGRIDAPNTAPVFVYTGMGPQWWAMGRQLWETEPVYRAAIEAVDARFAPLAGWSLQATMLAPEVESRMTTTEVAQPANFALQYALTRLWDSWGVKPAAIVGHSVGEIAAVVAAGALNLAEAVAIVYHRSRLQKEVEGQGRMLATNLTPDEAAEVAADLPGLVSLAAVNSGTSTVLAGDPTALDELARGLEAAGHFARPLRVEVAYHSHQMEPLCDPLRTALAGLTPTTPRVPLYSSVSGGRVESAVHDAGYWVQNLREPVQFAQAVAALLTAGHRTFLEVGPHPVLGGALREMLLDRGLEGACAFSLKRQEPEAATLRVAAAILHTRGVTPDWSVLNPASPGHLIDLPAYPWQRERLWIESEASRIDRLGTAGPALLGDRRNCAGYQRVIRLAPQRLPWLEDHRVEGATIFPGAGYVDALVSAARDLRPDQTSITLESVAFHHLLVLSPQEDSLLQLDCDPVTGECRIEGARASQPDAWQLHASARLVRGELGPPPPPANLPELESGFPAVGDPAVIYHELAARQLNYGPAFRRLVSLRQRPGAALVRLAAQPGDSRHLLHPGLLDGAFQALLGTLNEAGQRPGTAYVPTGAERVTWFASPTGACHALVELTEVGERSLRGDAQLFDETGRVLVDLKGIRCQVLSASTAADAGEPPACIETWEPIELTAADVPTQPIILLGEGAAATAAAQHLKALGWSVEPGSELPARVDHAGAIYDLRALDAPLAPDDAARRCHALSRPWVDLATTVTPPRFTVFTRRTQPAGSAAVEEPATAALWGLARTARLEYPNLGLRLIDLDDETSLPTALAAAAMDTAESELAVRDTLVLARRLVAAAEIVPPEPMAATPDQPCRLEVGEPGLVSSLHLRAAARQSPGPGEVEVRVECAPINFKDVLKALGTIDEKVLAGTFCGEGLGMEFSGIVSAVGSGVVDFKPGDTVYGAVRGGSMRTHVLLDPEVDLIFHEPAVPGIVRVPQFLPAVTVWRGLKEIARLAAGDRILIHSATGAVGLYAVSYAQSVGAEIFATAGNEEKRAYLRELGVKHVYDSRSLIFADAIRTATGGRGLDVVLNALAGEALRQSLALLAPYGRFIEIGKQDIAANSGLPLEGFNRNLLFAAIDIDRMLVERRSEFVRLLHETNAARAAGILRDPPVRVFPVRDSAEAFQLVAQARHIGKFGLAFDLTDARVHGVADKPLVRPDATYLITGGLDGFGAETVRWLAAQGAGRLVLAGRRGRATPGAETLCGALESAGARLEIVALDVADQSAVGSLIKRLARDPLPLRGVFHAAGVLADRPMADLTANDFASVFAPKVAGAMTLHLATQDLPLDHFVLFSSIAAVTGNPGQANYTAANAVLDALAAHRRARGLPGTSVNWGAIARVGMAARDEQVATHLERIGLHGIEPAAALAAWAARADTAPNRLVLAEVDWEKWLAHHPGAAAPLLTHLRQSAAAQTRGGTALPSDFDRLPPATRRLVVAHIVREEAALVLKTTPERIEGNRPFTQLGVDSLMEIELRIALGKALGVEMSRMDFARAATLDAATAEFARRLGLAPAPGEPAIELTQLSGADLDALLQTLESTENR